VRLRKNNAVWASHPDRICLREGLLPLPAFCRQFEPPLSPAPVDKVDCELAAAHPHWKAQLHRIARCRLAVPQSETEF